MKNSKTTWITGASSGIGRAVALRLALQGHHVIASARDENRLLALRDEALAGNSEARVDVLPFNVTDTTSIDTMQRRLSELTPGIDLCILSAGHCEYIEDAELDVNVFERVFNTNFFGAVNSVKIALPLLRKAPGGRGHLVAVSSLASVIGFPRAEAYGASKAALGYLFESLRIDLMPDSIDVTVINPGFVRTRMTDKNDFSMPFLMEVEEAARRITRAIERRPRSYSFPGRLSWLLRFMSWFPGLWLRVMQPRQRGGVKS